MAELSASELARLEGVARGIRRQIVTAVYQAQAGHQGGALSLVEIVTYLFFHQMRLDPGHPDWPDRDRFILSKGHGCLALYAALAGRGYFPQTAFDGFDHVDGLLQGHPDRVRTPWVEISAGTLGQGLSVGIGMALGHRLDGRRSHIYVAMGDGECQEGQVWEAAMAAAHYGIDTLTAIIDRNRLQICGDTEDVMALEPLAARWQAFGWHTVHIDGHSLSEIAGGVAEALATRGRPTVIIADTVKGKGVSYMENRAEWHSRPISDAQYAQAMAELAEVEVAAYAR